MKTVEKRLFNSAEVMTMYGFSRETLRKLINAGKFPPPVPAYLGARMWLIDALEDWEEKIQGRG